MRLILGAVGAMAVGAPSFVTAQFEGVIKQRTISVEHYALADRDIDVSEAIFDLPTERILALRAELEADGAMTVEETEITIKGKKIRMDMMAEDGPAWATMDLEQGIIRMVQPSQKMYMEYTKEDMERMKSMYGGMPGGVSDGDSEPSEPRQTGQTRTINGLSCAVFEIETDDESMRLCVSKDHKDLAATFAELMETVNSMSMEQEDVDESRLIAKYGFPVLAQQLTYDTYEIDEMLSMDRQSVSDDLFEPPAGYKKVTMADMMRGR